MKKIMFKKTSIILLILVMTFSFVFTYGLTKKVKASIEEVSYVNENGETKSVNDYTLASKDTNSYGSVFLVVKGEVTIKNVTFNNTKIILTDGSKLICVGDSTHPGISDMGDSLSIYAQSTDKESMGSLICKINDGVYSTQSAYSGDNLCINGGNVIFTGSYNYESGANAGVGASAMGGITVNDGYATFVGGNSLDGDAGKAVFTTSLCVNSGEVRLTGGKKISTDTLEVVGAIDFISINATGYNLKYKETTSNSEYALYEGDLNSVSNYFSTKSEIIIRKSVKNKITNIKNSKYGSTSVKDEAFDGDIVTVETTTANGYKLYKLNVYKTDDESTKVESFGNKFIMPSFPVTIKAEFNKNTDNYLETTTTDGSLTSRITNIFDEKGNKIEAYSENYTNSEWVPDKKYNYEYNEKGEEILSESMDYNEGAWITTLKSISTYGEFGIVKKTTYSDNNGTLYLRREYSYEYDDNGNMIKNNEKAYNVKGDIIADWLYLYEFDDENRKTKYILYKYTPGTTNVNEGEMDEYTYKDKAKNVKSYAWHEGQFKYYQDSIYYYNDIINGNLLYSKTLKYYVNAQTLLDYYSEIYSTYNDYNNSLTRLSSKNGVVQTLFEYEYDEYNNIIEENRYSYESGNSSWLITNSKVTEYDENGNMSSFDTIMYKGGAPIKDTKKERTPLYKITDKTDDNNLISFNKYEYSGNEVEVTVSPELKNNLYKLYYNDGTNHEIVANAENKYIFTMPASDVTIKATYKITNITNNEYGLVSIKDEGYNSEVITVNVTPTYGYKLYKLNVYKTGDESTKVPTCGNKFTMPSFPVTVEAEFNVGTTSYTIVTTVDDNVTQRYSEVYDEKGKNVETYTEKYINGAWVPSARTLKPVDENGNQIYYEVASYSNGAWVISVRYEYVYEGLIATKSYTYRNNDGTPYLQTSYEYEYDDKGNKVATYLISYKKDGSIDYKEKYEYTYDDQNRVIKDKSTRTKSDTEEISMILENEYIFGDKCKETKKYQLYKGDMVLVTYYMICYNDSDYEYEIYKDRVNYYTNSPTPKNRQEIYTTYDEYNNPLTILTKTVNGSYVTINESLVEFKYDDYLNIIEQINYKYVDDKAVFNTKVQYEYNSFGNLTKETNYSYDTSKEEWNITSVAVVEYDSDENILVRTTTSYTNGEASKVEIKNYVPLYFITNETSDENNSISSIRYQNEGYEVEIIITLDSKYELDKLYYNDGTDHEVVANASSKYIFTMPASDITIKATFKKTDSTLFNEYQEEKNEYLDTLLSDKDSTELTTIITNGKTQISEVTFDDTKSLENNKKILDDIVKEIKDAFELQKNKEAFESYKSTLTDKLDKVEKDYNNIIENAKQAVSTKEYDDTKTLDENKAIINEITDKALEDVRKTSAPKIIEGVELKVDLKKKNVTAKFRSEANFDEFIKVTINGVELSKEYYNAYEGSIIIELKDSYLRTLKNGKYDLSIISTNGHADTDFTISGQKNNSWIIIVIIILVVLILAYGLGYFCYRKGHMDKIPFEKLYSFLPKQQKEDAKVKEEPTKTPEELLAIKEEKIKLKEEKEIKEALESFKNEEVPVNFEGENRVEVCDVLLSGSKKYYKFLTNGLTLNPGNKVIVNTAIREKETTGIVIHGNYFVEAIEQTQELKPVNRIK